MDGAGCNVREARQRGDEPWRGKLSVVVSVGGIRTRGRGERKVAERLKAFKGLV